jgi:galactokinase
MGTRGGGDGDMEDRNAVSSSSFRVKAPGRICFFGEHSDYLGFPVIARAIPLYCSLDVQVKAVKNESTKHNNTTPNVVIYLQVPKDLGPGKVYDLCHLPPSPPSDATESVDFALAAIHEVLKENWDLIPHHLVGNEEHGYNFFEVICRSSSGELPLQAGCSSSTAFLVAWVLMLAKLADQDKTLTPMQLAQLAHRAEVTHFGHPGGTMDHVSIALGTIVAEKKQQQQLLRGMAHWAGTMASRAVTRLFLPSEWRGGMDFG